MPLSEHNWERFFHQKIEKSGEQLEGAKKNEKSKNKEEEIATSHPKITSKNAQRIAVKLLRDKEFKKILKEFIAEKIAQKELFTRLDGLVKIKSSEDYIKLYDLTYKHFEDIENGNLSSFDLIEDDGMVGITFRRISGHSSLRYLDDKILSDILNIIFESRPEYNDDLNLRKK